MPRYTTTVAKRLRTIMSELHELRRIRGEYERLVTTLQELGISGGQNLRQSARLVAAGARSGGGKRYRSSPAEMESQCKALASACGAAWMSRDAICQKAGLDPKRCAAAFKRLTDGYEVDGKKVKALLESNGKRGLGGAYRKA